MIVSKNISPQHDVYYLGAKLIELLSLSDKESYDYYELHKEFVKTQEVSFSLFLLVLDWLFILGVVRNVDNGGITKCF